MPFPVKGHDVEQDQESSVEDVLNSIMMSEVEAVPDDPSGSSNTVEDGDGGPEPVDGDDDPEALGDPEAEVDESIDDVTVDIGETEVVPKSRAQARIQALADSNKTLEGELAGVRDEARQRATWSEQRSAQQLDAYKQQIGSYVKDLEDRLVSVQEDKTDSGDEEAKFRRSIRRDLDPRMAKMLDQRVRPMEQEVLRLRGALKQREEAEEVGRVTKAFEIDSENAVRDILVEQMGEEEAGKMSRQTADWFMNAAAAHRKPPEAFKDDFKAFMDKAYTARRSHEQRQRRAKKGAKPSKSVSAPNRRGAAGTKGNALPQYTKEEIWNGGYADRWDAARDGYRKIQRRKGPSQ